MRPPALRSLVAAAALLGVAGVAAGCDLGRAPDPALAERARLEAEVEALRDRLATRLAADSLVRQVAADSSDILIGLRTPLLRRLVGSATRRYLDQVRLHVAPDLVVHEADDVGLRIGPIRVKAGEWRVRVTILRIDGTLSADSVELAMADSNRLDVVIPVETRDGSGRARIDFEWDAEAATSLICRSFEVSETFSGLVSPRRYRIRGSFLFATEGERIVARPVRRGARPVVSPEPTAEAWERVREILDRQNHIFRCGLALSPDGLERRLRELLTRGFRFELPDAILEPIILPASVREEVEVDGRTFGLIVRPLLLRLSSEALWYGASVRLVEGRQSWPGLEEGRTVEEVAAGPATELSAETAYYSSSTPMYGSVRKRSP